MSEAYLTILSGKARCRNPDGFVSFAFGVVRNEARRLIRQRAQRQTGTLDDEGWETQPDGGPSPLDATATAEERERTEKLVRDVCSPGESEAVVLVDLDGLTAGEAARKLDRSPGVVHSQLSKGRAKLRQHVEWTGGLGPAE